MSDAPSGWTYTMPKRSNPVRMKEIQPTTIRLEAMSACQLRCPTCPTTTGEARPVVGSGYLKVADFKSLLEKNPWVRHVELSNFGEILLSPDFLAILEAAQLAGVAVSADNGLNLNTASERQLEGMVRYGLRSATISLDGASQETYSQYRIRGNFDTVIANVEAINRFKREYGSRAPELTWQFVVFGHNEHELPAAKAMAERLGMRWSPKLNWDSTHAPVRDLELVRRYAGAASREEYEARFGKAYRRGMCTQLWNAPQINWDGKVLGCCVNHWGEFGGNAFRDGLREALNSEGMRYAREMLRGRSPAKEGIPCTTCAVYEGMKAREDWLGEKEVRAKGTSVLRRLRRKFTAG